MGAFLKEDEREVLANLSGLKREKSAGAPEESPPVVGVACAEAMLFRLQVELERVQFHLAGYEHKYRMTFEEFQANVGPWDPPEFEQDWLEWSHWAEEQRVLLADLEHLSRIVARLRALHPEQEPSPPDQVAARIGGMLGERLSVTSWPTRGGTTAAEGPQGRMLTQIADLLRSSRSRRPQG